jgi:hypothetical protein
MLPIDCSIDAIATPDKTQTKIRSHVYKLAKLRKSMGFSENSKMALVYE